MKISRGRILAGVLAASIGCGACEAGAAQIRALGFDYDAIPPVDFARFIAKELATWAPVIKEAGIRAD